MTIVQADLKFYHAEEVSEATTNGGAMDQTNEAVSGVKNNIWPNVSSAQRAAGHSLYRKIFVTPESDTDDILIAPMVWNHAPTPGDDYIYLFAGTKTDTEATLDDTRKYGTGTIVGTTAIDDLTIVVEVENAALTGVFAAEDLIRISNQASPEGTGDYQEVRLSTSTPTVSVNEVTLFLSEGLTTAFAEGSYVSSVLELADTDTDTGTIVVTSSAGTVNDSSYPPILNNAGTLDETITVTFSTTTAYSVAGSKSGALGSGTTTADFTATNPNNAKTLITLESGFFTGTWAALDTVVIPTVANSAAVWLARIVPAATDSLASNENITAYAGESA